MSDTIPKIKAQRYLVLIWTLIFLATLGILAHYVTGATADTEPIKLWYSPYVVPTLTLMLGSLAAAEIKGEPGESSRFFFLLCCGLSVAYGLYLFYALGDAINTQAQGARTMETDQVPDFLLILKPASWVLSFMQPVINAALGAFFVMTPKKNETIPPAEKTQPTNGS